LSRVDSTFLILAQNQIILKIKSWIEAARLRTLPLAFSVILMSGFLAYFEGKFCGQVFGLCILTTLFLQILSNFANDYGDTQNGADNAERKGPIRAVQGGKISKREMLIGMLIMSLLTLISGLTLLFVSFGGIDFTFIGFLLLGLVCIAAAIKYTAGKNPYGYAGLGDLSVFIFFGLVGVLGSNFLYTHSFHILNILPAISCGVFSVAVLNLNNIRDILSDTLAGKKTIPVRIGFLKSKYYHYILIFSGIFSALLFFIFLNKILFGIILLALSSFLFVKLTLIPLFKADGSDNIDHLLKKTALSTLFFVLVFGLLLNF
jgi:1,4-dihydroxy-2-naphthoate polyprenyltransferase